MNINEIINADLEELIRRKIDLECEEEKYTEEGEKFKKELGKSQYEKALVTDQIDRIFTISLGE